MRIFTLLLLLVSYTSIFAQNAPVDIVWGNDYREPNNSVMRDFIGNDTEGYYAVRKGTSTGIFGNAHKLYIEKYNMSMKLVKRNEIKLKYKRKDLQFEDIQLIDGKLYLFTSYRNRKRKINYLFAQIINKKSLRLRKNIEIITQIPAKRQLTQSSFDISFSKDSSKVLFLAQLPYQSKEEEKFNIRVCNLQLETLWEKNIQLPYSSAMFETQSHKIDEEGNVHILGILYQSAGQKRRRNRKPNYEYVLLSYRNQGEAEQKSKISFGDRFITDLTFDILENGDAVCAGFYSDKNAYSVRGTYFLKVNKDTGEIYDQNTKEFDFAFLTELYSDRQKRKARKAEGKKDVKRQAELYEYSLDKLIMRSDGGAVLIAEQYYIQTEQHQYRDINGFWQYRGYDHYNYNDIIVVNISPSGEIDWATHVPKRQVTVDDGGYFSSYSTAVTSDAVYLVFNDNGKNFENDSDRLYKFNGSRSVVALVEVKQDGITKKYPLFSNREEGIITRPKISKQTNSDELIIYGERGRKNKFAKLKFQSRTK